MTEPLYPPPPPSAPPPTYGGANAAQMVKGPAIALMVVGAIGIVWSLFGILGNLLGFGMAGLEDIGGDSQWVSMMSSGSGILFSIIQLAVSAFVIWGALQMQNLRKYQISLGASIAAMLPCVGPCCLLGLPIGIWALVILMKPEVKAAFAD